MLLTLLHTAARRGEIFRLAWSDVDFEHGTIRLGTRKRAGGGMQFDVIPMTAKLSEVLREHRKTCPGTLVFPRPDGGRYLSRGNFFRDLCARVGVKRFGFHGVRHLSASVMARKGMAVPGIQAILRHRTPLTTARYLHRLGVLKQDLDRVFSGYE
jgi:integrase